jgi:hypothetical protein
MLGVMLLSGLSGYRLGALKVVGLLGAVATAIAFAPRYGMQIEPQVAQWLGTSGLTNRVAGIGFVALAITLAAYVVVAVLSRRLLTDQPRLAAWNRWIGFGLGGVQGGLVVFILLSGLLIVEPLATIRADELETHDPFGLAVSRQVSRIGERTRASKLRPAIAACNPFDHVPQLSRVQQSVRVVSDPERLDQLARHPVLEEMKQSPTLRGAIDTLLADSEIREVLESGKRVDMQAAISLMNNPAILQVLDDPDFLKEMSKIVCELDPDRQESRESVK